MKRFLFTTFLILSLVTPIYGGEAETMRVAVIDSGVSTASIAAQNLTEGYNYIAPKDGTGDWIGHGTAIASLIVGSDPAEVPGICPEAVLVPLVFYTKDASGEEVSADAEQVAQAIYDAVDQYRCKIINLSFCSPISHDVLREAVDYAEEQGVLVIASAGNWQEILPGITSYPGGYDSVICVGASREDGTVAGFSLRGETVDLFAQGVGLTTATRQGSRHTVEGTSYAAAIVTGAAAQIWVSYPDLTADEVRTILLNSTAVVDDWKMFDLEEALAWKPEYVETTFPYMDVSDCMEMAIRWAMNKISLFLKNVSLE